MYRAANEVLTNCNIHLFLNRKKVFKQDALGHFKKVSLIRDAL